MKQKITLPSLRDILISKNKNQKINPKLFLLLGLGIALMLIGHFVSAKSPTSQESVSVANMKTEPSVETWKTEKSENTQKSAIEKSYESELQTALEQMSDVSDVTVVVKLQATEKKIYEKDTSTVKKQTDETDQNDGQRTIEEFNTDEKVVIIKDGSKEIPLVIQTEMPEVKGVLVVAKGVGNLDVKAKVIEAVTRVFDIGSHRVAVMEKTTEK